MPKYLAQDVHQNAAFAFDFAVEDIPGQPRDITSDTLSGGIAYAQGQAVVAAFTFTKTTPEAGEATASCTAAATDGLTPDELFKALPNAVYDIFLTTSGGTKYRLYYGDVSIYPKVA